VGIQGPVFTDIKPQNLLGAGGELSYTGSLFTPLYTGLDLEASKQIVPGTLNQFRIGQTIFFEFEIFIETAGVTAILLQPWWQRPQQEFRTIPGVAAGEYLDDTPDGRPGVDTYAFGPPGISLGATNRLWQTDQKRLDQIDPVGPPAVPAGKSYSTMLDNVFRFEINSALVGAGYSFTKAFHWPAHGYTLAFTSDYEGVPGVGPTALPNVALSFKTGATHSISQENVE
jgi:hypothetical protein